MPLSAPSEAAFTTASISSFVVARAGDEAEVDHRDVDGRHAHREAGELAVEFRQHQPTAAAAPVLVGICDIVAERARRRSLWNTSVST
jgi:hypothetical protein